MVFYFLISIVFIAEVIITAAILINLAKFDRVVCSWSDFLVEIKPQITDILENFKKISEQALEFAPILVNKCKNMLIKLVLDQIKGALAGLTFWAVKKEVEKRIN